MLNEDQVNVCPEHMCGDEQEDAGLLYEQVVCFLDDPDCEDCNSLGGVPTIPTNNAAEERVECGALLCILKHERIIVLVAHVHTTDPLCHSWTQLCHNIHAKVLSIRACGHAQELLKVALKPHSRLGHPCGLHDCEVVVIGEEELLCFALLRHPAPFFPVARQPPKKSLDIIEHCVLL